MKCDCKRELCFLYKWNCSALESVRIGHKKKIALKYVWGELLTFRKKNHENPEKLLHESL